MCVDEETTESGDYEVMDYEGARGDLTTKSLAQSPLSLIRVEGERGQGDE